MMKRIIVLIVAFTGISASPIAPSQGHEKLEYFLHRSLNSSWKRLLHINGHDNGVLKNSEQIRDPSEKLLMTIYRGMQQRHALPSIKRTDYRRKLTACNADTMRATTGKGM